MFQLFPPLKQYLGRDTDLRRHKIEHLIPGYDILSVLVSRTTAL